MICRSITILGLALLFGGIAALQRAHAAPAESVTVQLDVNDANDKKKGALRFQLQVGQTPRFLLGSELRVVFLSVAGRPRFVLSNRPVQVGGSAPDNAIPVAIAERSQREFASLLLEIRDHCAPTDEQIDKLEAASHGENARLARIAQNVTQQRIVVEDDSQDAFADVAKQLVQLNSLIEQGILRSDSLIRGVCSQVLDDEQKSQLRWAYLQPLLQILKTDPAIHFNGQRLEHLIMSSKLDPLELRGNYGGQFELVAQLGTELSTVFDPKQLAAFERLGKTDHRITLSRKAE